MTAALQEMLARVEGAEDRHHLREMVKVADVDACCRTIFGKAWTSADYGLLSDALFKGSVDAALLLIEVALPGWRIRLQIDGDGTNEAFLENKGDFGAIDAKDTRSFCVSPALAILAACLRALIAKGWA